MLVQLGHLASFGDLLGLFGISWGCLGHLSGILGTLEAWDRAAWVVLGHGLGYRGMLHKGLGEFSGSFEGFGGGLALLPEKPKSTLTVFLV